MKPAIKPECPPEMAVIDSISGKWNVLIVHTLSEKPLRNGELKRAVTGISHKVLTQSLRQLERDGIVARKVYPVVPPQVEYSLTPLGMSLTTVLTNICEWAKDNYPQVRQSRERYAKREQKKLTQIPQAV